MELLQFKIDFFLKMSRQIYGSESRLLENDAKLPLRFIFMF
jgi:hypothetical protein